MLVVGIMFVGRLGVCPRACTIQNVNHLCHYNIFHHLSNTCLWHLWHIIHIRPYCVIAFQIVLAVCSYSVAFRPEPSEAPAETLIDKVYIILYYMTVIIRILVIMCIIIIVITNWLLTISIRTIISCIIKLRLCPAPSQPIRSRGRLSRLLLPPGCSLAGCLQHFIRSKTRRVVSQRGRRSHGPVFSANVFMRGWRKYPCPYPCVFYAYTRVNRGPEAHDHIRWAKTYRWGSQPYSANLSVYYLQRHLNI